MHLIEGGPELFPRYDRSAESGMLLAIFATFILELLTAFSSIEILETFESKVFVCDSSH